MKTVVMIPTYNEKVNIGNMIKEIKNLKIPNLSILVVDDDSPDGTANVVKKISRIDKAVNLLLRKTLKGRGYAGQAGFKRAIKMGADAVLEMDADFSHQPKDIPKLLDKIKSADLVLGSRYTIGGSEIGRGVIRRLITKAANFYIRIMLGLKVKDCNSGFRCFRKKALIKINIDKLISKGPSIVQEVLYKVHLKGLIIKEVPITFVEREMGTSKLGMKQLIQGYVMVLKLKWMKISGKI